MSAQHLGDVRRQAVEDGVGDEQPAEVVRGEGQGLAIAAGQTTGHEDAAEQLPDAGGADRAGLSTERRLEQQRHRGVPDAFGVVVGRDQRDGAVLLAHSADDGAEDVGEFGVDEQQPLRVGLRWRDLQQRHQFPCGGQPVFGDAVVAEFAEFLDADSGVPQDFDRGPGPEGVVLFAGEVSLAVVVDGPDLAALGVGGVGAPQRLSAGGEQLAGAGTQRCLQSGGGVGPFLVRAADQVGQHGQPFAGALVHAGLDPGEVLAQLDLAVPDGTRRGPRTPAGRVLDGPPGDVAVEAADRDEFLLVVDPGLGHFNDITVGVAHLDGLGLDALLPRASHVRGQVQRVDAGMMAFQVTFRFADLAHLAEYAATCPKYHIPPQLTADPMLLAAQLRRRLPDGPVETASAVTYLVAAAPA